MSVAGISFICIVLKIMLTFILILDFLCCKM